MAGSFDKLIEAVTEYVRSYGLSEQRVKQYQIIWRNLKRYVDETSNGDFSTAIGNAYLDKYALPRHTPPMSAYEKIRVRAVFILGDYQQNASIRVKRPRKIAACPKEYESEYTGFVNYLAVKGLSDNSIACYAPYVIRLFESLIEQEIFAPEDLSTCALLDFFSKNTTGNEDRAGYGKRLIVAKHYLRYLSDKGFKTDRFNYIFHQKSKRAQVLPAVYTKDEISKLKMAIDKSTPIGKRDCAVFQLASLRGMRTSDIANLRFENIDWVQSTIRFYQVKTGKAIELPLLCDVGESIVDYLLNGRPDVHSEYVFLTHTVPFRPMNSGSLCGRFRIYFGKSKINTDGRRSNGPHCLRHSLASALLKEKTELPTIQRALGHTNSNTTKHYIRIDTDMLRACALEVPCPTGIFAKTLQGGQTQ